MGGGGSFSSASGVPAGGFQPVGPGAGVAGGMPHDVYPGITHFTDTMFAIPRELRRHESLFKEVDGKSWALEERLPVVLGEVGRMIMEPAKNGVRPAEEETAFGKGVSFHGFGDCLVVFCLLGERGGLLTRLVLCVDHAPRRIT